MSRRFNDSETSVIRELHESFIAGESAFEADQLAEKCGISRSDLESLRVRLKNYGALETSTCDRIVVGAGVVDVYRDTASDASDADVLAQATPSPRFGLIAIAVVPPLIYVWYLMIRDLVVWLGAK